MVDLFFDQLCHSRINLILGPRRCGKSELVEKYLSKEKSKIYFGTLWNNNRNSVVIERHRERRQKDWIEYESIGNPFEDIQHMVNILGANDNGKACLLDGLLVLVLHYMKAGYTFSQSLSFLMDLLNTLSSDTNCKLFLIDVSTDSETDFPNIACMEYAKEIHNVVISTIQSLNLILWSNYACS